MPDYRASLFDIRDEATSEFELAAPDLGAAARTIWSLLADNPADPQRRIWRVEVYDGPDVALSWFLPMGHQFPPQDPDVQFTSDEDTSGHPG